MAGIERIEILDTSNYLKERKQIGDDAIPDLNSIYMAWVGINIKCKYYIHVCQKQTCRQDCKVL
jgi:hypothetical protein